MPSKKKPTRKKSTTQKQAFIEAAHKAGCDESEAAFEGKLRRIAKSAPKRGR